MKGLSYQSGNQVLNDDGKYMFVNQSVFMNRFNETEFEDLLDDSKARYLESQVLDILRLPLFNSDATSIVTYYQGFNNGDYSYIGDEVETYSERAAIEIENGKQEITAITQEECWVPLEDLSWTYDPRCRPWYITARENIDTVELTTF